MNAAIYARKSAVLLLVVLIAHGCSKPFTPLTTATIDCAKSTGDNWGNSDAFQRCMHDKGWVFNRGAWEQNR